MTRRESAIVTDLSLTLAEAETLIQIETWGDVASVSARIEAMLKLPLPAPCRSTGDGDHRLMWWEPQTWLLRAPGEARQGLRTQLQALLGEDGAETDLSGAFQRIRLEGGKVRDLLMIGAVSDAESSAFAPGCIAGTVLHHLPVRLDVVAEGLIDAYTPPSYAEALLHHWRIGAARLG
jgi:heterotetrameric sarcosine oxidase gamma subunit